MTLIAANPGALTNNDARASGSDIEPASADELAQAEREHKLAIVQALGEALSKKRKEAMEYRTSTGIESDWDEDEEFYNSQDRANPEGDTNVGKPVSPDGGPIGLTPVAAPARSSVFIPITRAYVDAASARVGDMLLPTDDAPWAIKPTPVQQDHLTGLKPTPVAAAAGAVAGTRPMPQDALMPPGKASPGLDPIVSQAMGMSPEQAVKLAEPGAPVPMSPQPMGVSNKGLLSETDKTEEDMAAEKATKIITDWLIECQWHAEVRRVIEDAAMFGTGVLKGPFPMERTGRKYKKDAFGRSYIDKFKEIAPYSKRIHPRNFWVDPACGGDVQAGSYTFEMDKIGSRLLRKFKDDPTYIEAMLDRVLEEGPDKINSNTSADSAERLVDVGATFTIWYFYGDLDKETLLAAGVAPEDFEEGVDIAIPAMVVMVNDTVIKACLSPIEDGGFPYDVMPWQRRSGMVWGKGIARQIRTAQRMLNGAVRAMMDNAGLTSGPLYAIRDKWIKALDGGPLALTPRKGFKLTNDAPPDAKIQDCISFTNVQSNVTEMDMIIMKALKFAEDATGLPMLLQGQQGSAPDTVGGMTILNNNGSTVLRRIARLFDDCITERHIRRYYYWLLMSEGNDDAKGDFQIDARGSTALVERDIQNQALNNLAPLFMQHPDVHKGRLAEELAKANRLDPKRFMMTDAEKAERDKNPPPPPVPLLIAQMREQGQTERLGMTLQQQDKHHGDEQQIRIAEVKAAYEKFLGDLAAKVGISADNIKAMLAVKAAEMGQSAHENAAGRAEKWEPGQRAPAGEAVSQ